MCDARLTVSTVPSAGFHMKRKAAPGDTSQQGNNMLVSGDVLGDGVPGHAGRPDVPAAVPFPAQPDARVPVPPGDQVVAERGPVRVAGPGGFLRPGAAPVPVDLPSAGGQAQHHRPPGRQRPPLGQQLKTRRRSDPAGRLELRPGGGRVHHVVEDVGDRAAEPLFISEDPRLGRRCWCWSLAVSRRTAPGTPRPAGTPGVRPPAEAGAKLTAQHVIRPRRRPGSPTTHPRWWCTRTARSWTGRGCRWCRPRTGCRRW